MTITNSNASNGTGQQPTAWGTGLTQQDLMEKDTVLVLDNADNIIGTASKKDSHVFSATQPHGVLHRAFSVFLFDESGRLLLQQRAASKITFPNVWTNTCCSHPLTGMDPPEIDTLEDVANGSVAGVKHAAMRKLQHELGITGVTEFKFLTRLHYWAADTVTHGPDAPWGEHEIDYVLFAQVQGNLQVDPHPDEVDDTKWVTMDELKSMLADDTLLFSPWFRLICTKWLYTWWADLDACLTTDKHCDYTNIYEFDPPTEHLGGVGQAGPLFVEETVVGDASKKQGAYGKVPTHKESKLAQLAHIDEVFAAVTFLYIAPLRSNLDTPFVRDTFDAADLSFCDEILVQVSRSFAAVIRQLPATLLVDILVFYLVLRALDTIEDDMTAFGSNEIKVQHLLNFYKNALTDPNWSMDGIGQGDEARLLREFPKCQRVYSKLQPQSRRVIADITQRMAIGMAEFVGKDLGQGTTDIAQYNRYCHFVAGLVGEGLSRLFAASGLEKASFGRELHLSDQMGLFLQKTNIIRDYLEDYVDQRAFWPQSVWKKYSVTGDLGYFCQQEDAMVRAKSLACLTELVTDALELVPDCLAYMSKLQCQEIFRFCAIPQVMAIATLDKCYANPDVFTGVVKIRKGLSCKLILRTNNLAEVHETFYHFARSIIQKAEQQRSKGVLDPSYSRTLRACETICDLTSSQARQQRRSRSLRWLACAAPIVAASAWQYVPMAMEKLDVKWSTAVRTGLLLSAVVMYKWGPFAVTSDLKSADVLKTKTA